MISLDQILQNLFQVSNSRINYHGHVQGTTKYMIVSFLLCIEMIEYLLKTYVSKHYQYL
jgi:hypothetical protein